MSNPFTQKDPLFDIINQVMLGEKKLTDAEMKKREEIAQAMERENPGMDMGKKMAIATATAKKVAGEVNLDEQLENFWEAYTTMFNEAEDQQQNMLLRAMAKDPTDLMKMKRAIKMGDKALTNPALRQEILAMLDKMMTLTTTDKSLLQRTRMGFQKAKTMKMPEEVQLEAIGAKDKQDEGEYGYEGDMAMSQLRTIIRNCQEMMKVLDKETDMPEWVQSKITLATDYLQTANDYLMSELEEAVRIRDRSRGFEKEVKYAGRTFAVNRHGDDKQTFQGQMDRKHLAVAAKARRKRTGPGVKGFNSAMRSAKASDGYQPQETGSMRAKNEEVEKAPFEGGREVKSSKPAAMRVKKIAKGMQKLNTPKDKK
jgi:hypothetical protein